MHEPPEQNFVPETSSGPIQIPEEQQALFREILDLLEKKGVSFVVAGAFALREHTGIFRDTKDLDLFLTPANANLALDYLREAGFECEVCDPVWLFKARRDGFFVDLITGMSNATIVVDDSWIERSVPASVQGINTRVLAAEELVASKLFIARRERFDGADIAHVIYGTGGKLDWRRVLSLVGEHWEMLFWTLVLFRYCYPAQTQYVPQQLWDELISRFQAAISNPEPTAKFRGSLVDDKQFAIDVNEWGMENLMQEYRQRRLKSIPVIHTEI
jgi:predicted nucleotidyltransferase